MGASHFQRMIPQNCHARMRLSRSLQRLKERIKEQMKGLGLACMVTKLSRMCALDNLKRLDGVNEGRGKSYPRASSLTSSITYGWDCRFIRDKNRSMKKRDLG